MQVDAVSIADDMAEPVTAPPVSQVDQSLTNFIEKLKHRQTTASETVVLQPPPPSGSAAKTAATTCLRAIAVPCRQSANKDLSGHSSESGGKSSNALLTPSARHANSDTPRRNGRPRFSVSQRAGAGLAVSLKSRLAAQATGFWQILARRLTRRASTQRSNQRKPAVRQSLLSCRRRCPPRQHRGS